MGRFADTSAAIMSNNYFEQQRSYGFGLGITYGVQVLLLLTAAIFVFQLVVDIPFGSAPGYPPGGTALEWVDFSPADFLAFQLWGVVSYMFLHAGLWHLFTNMLMLFIFGPDVERTLGTRQFVRFYLFCGVVGALANFVPLLLVGGAPHSVIGASGAALGIMVAFAMIDPDRQFFLIPFPFPITARAMVIIFIAINVANAVSGGGPVAVTTHFGGMAAGWAFMKFRPRFASWQLQRRMKRRQVPPEQEEKLGEAIDNIFKFQDKDRH